VENKENEASAVTFPHSLYTSAALLEEERDAIMSPLICMPNLLKESLVCLSAFLV
jgi:hypothetical protein